MCVSVAFFVDQQFGIQVIGIETLGIHDNSLPHVADSPDFAAKTTEVRRCVGIKSAQVAVDQAAEGARTEGFSFEECVPRFAPQAGRVGLAVIPDAFVGNDPVPGDGLWIFAVSGGQCTDIAK